MSSSQTSPARRLRDALEPIATVSFYSDPSTGAYAALGLTDFFPAYVWSRSSVLGVAEPAVVTAAFGVWAPDLISTNLAAAHRACSLDDIRGATLNGAAVATRDVLADIAINDVRDVSAVLRRGIDAADATGRPLFAGNRAWAWPDDPHALLWRAAFAWRELRGDSHLAACVSAGISGLQANILTELEVGYPLGEYTSTRHWSDDEIQDGADGLRDRGLLDGDSLTDAGTGFRADLENATDTAVERAVAAVGADLARVAERCNAWAQLIIDRGWFPDDEKKRAAG